MPYFVLYFVLSSFIPSAASLNLSKIQNLSTTTQRGCVIPDIKLFLLSDSESEFTVPDDRETYRIRVDEDILGDIISVNWTLGKSNYPVPAYSLQAACGSQQLVVDVDKKSLLVVEASDDNTKRPFTATVLFGDGQGVRQFKVTLRLDRPPEAKQVIGSIAVWAGIAGCVLILLAVFVVVFRYVEKRNYKRQLAALELPPPLLVVEAPTTVPDLPSEAVAVPTEPSNLHAEMPKMASEMPITTSTDQPTDATPNVAEAKAP